jgi:hypothetical protein
VYYIERRIREVELLQLVQDSEKNEQHSELECTPRWRMFQYWDSRNTGQLASLKIECLSIMNKYPEAVSIVQQIYKVLSDIENLAGCTRAKLGEALSGPLS